MKTLTLPPVREFTHRTWKDTYGADFYGALAVAAKYCGVASGPLPVPGMWQHGCMPPWQQIQPEVVAYLAPRSWRCFVGREDEVRYLQAAGYMRVEPIGLPIIYTQPTGAHRIPGSLLVMPTHSMPWDKGLGGFDAYVGEIVSIKHRFSKVAACISTRCVANGYWVPHFKELGIEVVHGADMNDANALPRIRTLMETFEYVTSNGWGSHIAYGLYFGAKISIWGTEVAPTRERLLQNGTWKPFPEAVDRYLSEETKERQREFLKPVLVEPWSAVSHVKMGSWLVGGENKLVPHDLRRIFRWNTFQRFQAAAIGRLKKAKANSLERLKKSRANSFRHRVRRWLINTSNG